MAASARMTPTTASRRPRPTRSIAVLYALKSDPAFIERFLADPVAATGELGLTEGERADLRRCDRDALVARGAHPYLVFMAELRLKMAAEPGTFEFF